MANHYMCSVCGKSVVTFDSWADMDPSELVELLAEELESHNIDTRELDSTKILSRFHIIGDEDQMSLDLPGVSGENPDVEGQ